MERNCHWEDFVFIVESSQLVFGTPVADGLVCAFVIVEQVDGRGKDTEEKGGQLKIALLDGKEFVTKEL